MILFVSPHNKELFTWQILLVSCTQKDEEKKLYAGCIAANTDFLQAPGCLQKSGQMCKMAVLQISAIFRLDNRLPDTAFESAPVQGRIDRHPKQKY